ncbi:unnamed protein product [Thlaspi arvense]|uniref:Cupin type-1 domain-containing protein n=1 Tax=Thlaspi arvense TaxID=13288 RepID=A0AAU9RHG6_THLAR|nr:unnamed protein product [Thlaspi arvense]
MGSAVTGANVEKIPGLNTLSVSLARIDYAPGGLNPPHTHPRATEVVYVLEGELEVGFITTANKLFSKTIKIGEVFVFPRGLVHFQKNNGKSPASVLSAFNSQLPGTVSVAAALFAAEPALPEDVLTKTFQVLTKRTIPAMPPKRNFRKRNFEEEEEDDQSKAEISDEEEKRRLALEEVKFLQKQRERKLGISALSTAQNSTGKLKAVEKTEVEGEKEELVLQDTFAQETAVLIEDPNMVKYIEQELAKKRGRSLDDAEEVENELKRVEDELYMIPDHLKVKKRSSEESSTQWTTGIAEVQLPIEYKLKNIEETEAAKKLLQEKRLMGRPKSEFNIPSSYSADYFQRGKDYAEKLRREHPELYKERGPQADGQGAKPSSSNNGAADSGKGRQAATDQIMLERFRKRERNRVMRR